MSECTVTKPQIAHIAKNNFDFCLWSDKKAQKAILHFEKCCANCIFPNQENFKVSLHKNKFIGTKCDYFLFLFVGSMVDWTCENSLTIFPHATTVLRANKFQLGQCATEGGFGFGFDERFWGSSKVIRRSFKTSFSFPKKRARKYVHSR